jgi:hypothetical protein
MKQAASRTNHMQCSAVQYSSQLWTLPTVVHKASNLMLSPKTFTSTLLTAYKINNTSYRSRQTTKQLYI